jgi:hypothetical protein
MALKTVLRALCNPKYVRLSAVASLTLQEEMEATRSALPGVLPVRSGPRRADGPLAAAELFGGTREDFTTLPAPKALPDAAPHPDAWRDTLWGLMLQLPDDHPRRPDLVAACSDADLTPMQGEALIEDTRALVQALRPDAAAQGGLPL